MHFSIKAAVGGWFWPKATLRDELVEAWHLGRSLSSSQQGVGVEFRGPRSFVSGWFPWQLWGGLEDSQEPVDVAKAETVSSELVSKPGTSYGCDLEQVPFPMGCFRTSMP